MRGLAEFSLLSGDLRAEGANAARMREGIINHQALQSLYEGGMQAEVPLEMTVPTKTCDLIVSGRGLYLLDKHVPIAQHQAVRARYILRRRWT